MTLAGTLTGLGAAVLAVGVVATAPIAGAPSATASAATASAATASAETLLSQGRPATASSVESSAYPATLAVDGNTGTRWASTEGVDPSWIQVDLGAVDSISRVQLTWEAAYGKAYQVQTSTDGSTWSTAYSTAAGDGGVDNLTGLTAGGRFVRVTGSTRGTIYGYSLYELQVYGTSGATSTPTPTPTATGAATGLDDAHKKDIAMQLVSSAENSSLDWKAQYGYIEDIGDGRGYTGGIIGFCSGTSDMLALVEYYTAQEPGNGLAKYLPALRAVDGTDSHAGLGTAFTTAWKAAAKDTVFQAAQNEERDRVYFNPAVKQAKADGLRALGQFAYYDAIVMHGPGDDGTSFGGIRATAMKKAKTPAQGGNETTYLNAFLDARKAAMLTEEAHSDTTRVDTEQRVFLNAGNLNLNPPLTWKVYGDSYTISS
jgi:chitosanase